MEYLIIKYCIKYFGCTFMAKPNYIINKETLRVSFLFTGELNLFEKEMNNVKVLTFEENRNKGELSIFEQPIVLTKRIV